jgi:hypothetical protein
MRHSEGDRRSIRSWGERGVSARPPPPGEFRADDDFIADVNDMRCRSDLIEPGPLSSGAALRGGPE